MKLRGASPLLLLLLSPIVAGDIQRNEHQPALRREALSNDHIPAVARQGPSLHKKEVLADTKDPSTPKYKGTEDAPVDGLDGKPHAGPFVDTTPEETDKKKPKPANAAKAQPTSMKNFGSEKDMIPEKNDGVMNDENRPVPGKGSTGTEGGVSERTKDKGKGKASAEKLPQKPKEAPPLPADEQDRVDKANEKSRDKPKPKKELKDSERSEKAVDSEDDDDYAGGLGLEKPTDLPDKPHNIPHPDPKGASLPSSQKESGLPVGSGTYKDTMPVTEGKTGLMKDADGNIIDGEMEWHEWFHSFVLSFTMIIFSEIGDKTFLVAALMAMRHPRLLVYSAAISALIAMTILSALLGHVVPTLIPKRYTTLAAAILFLVFGVRMMREGLAMDKDMGVGEEMKEVEAELEEKEHEARRGSRRRSSNVSPYALESGRGRKESASINLSRGEPSPPSSTEHSPSRSGDRVSGLNNLLGLVLSPAWVQTFIMTFLGEWGDRSQIATIAMAAGQDYWWVTLGAISGHAICTGIAVIGGAALAGKVSLRVVTIGGAGAFLVFGVIYLFECMNE